MGPNHNNEVPGDSNMNCECQEISIFKNSRPTKIHREVPENTLRRPKIHQSVSRQIDPQVSQRCPGCVSLIMVRSTLLPLRLRGALRAKSGGPLAVLFFVVQTQVCGTKVGSENKSFIVALVSNHDKSDGNHDLHAGPRDHLVRDRFWPPFWHQSGTKT